MKIFITSIILTLYFTEIALSCFCGNQLIDLPVEEMGWMESKTTGTANYSDLIFTAVLIDGEKITETYSSNFKSYQVEYYELKFKLIKSYKGEKSDTILVRTNVGGGDACAFSSPKNSECLIFAQRATDGHYYTYSSECCKSSSKVYDKKRYSKYIDFLESVTNMVDGEYVFYQKNINLLGSSSPSADSLEVIRYNIKNGKFEGLWQLTDCKGRVLEKGIYKNGLKTGTWYFYHYNGEINLKEVALGWKDTIEKVKYYNGKPKRSLMFIQYWAINNDLELFLEQKIRKVYKYPKVKKSS